MSYRRINGVAPLERTDSLCPPPEKVLLDAVRKNNVDTIESTVEQNEDILNHIYLIECKPILLVAVSEDEVEAETVQKLIDLGADVTFSDQSRWQALHYASQKADPKVLEIILRQLAKLQNDDINSLAEGNNALHILVRHATKSDEQISECANLLIRHGINVNQSDNKNITPIIWAAKKGLKQTIKTILETSNVPVDLDSHNLRGKTARNFIEENNLYDLYLPDISQSNTDPIQTLINYIKEGNQAGFVQYNNGVILEWANANDTESTLLQTSCQKGLNEIVSHLLKNGADPNEITDRNVSLPIEIAAENGYYEVLETLLNKSKIKLSPNVLIEILRKIDYDKVANKDYEKCYALVLEKLKKCPDDFDINSGDVFNNTPLHFAIRYGTQSNLKDMLDLGGSLGAKNRFERMPVEDIEPKVLEKHLDDCIEFESKSLDKEEFKVTFNYSTLIPPAKTIQPDSDEEQGETSDRKELVGETEVIEYMSRSPELKHLLSHPVIVSFLFVKWHQIQWLFYTNLSIYIVFFSSLVGYIFSHYVNFSDEEKSSAQNILMGLTWFLFLITFIFLIFRELFQIVVSLKKYFKNFENYLEIILLVTTGMILFDTNASNELKKQLASIGILLAAFELILMLGQHPKLSTNVVMLRTVSRNFFKFLMWYFVLILAFALSFYILFTDAGEKQPQNKTSEDGEDFFDDPGKSVFKTIVMLTGEFDAGSINFQTFPFTSKLIFSLFIFMIAIILLNLLNGLAVSDTQMIKNDAELVGHIARAQHIRHVESMLLGKVGPQNLFNWFNRVCCCFPMATCKSFMLARPLAEKVCLFSKCPYYKLVVYPNKYGLIDMPESKSEKKKSCTRCQNLYLDRETVKKIKVIVNEKRELLKEREQGDIMKKIEELMNSKIERLLLELRRN